MRMFLFAFFFEGILSFLLKNNISIEASENLVLIYILINTMLLITWFWYKSKDKLMFLILLAGFVLRLITMFYDRGIAPLPFNTMDANAFHSLAIETANTLPNVMLEHYTGFYSQALGIIYYIFGPYRVWGHFLNITFIMVAATKLIDIADTLKISVKNQKLLLSLWLFMPIPLLMGYALLREASIYYFIILSIYMFLKWYEKLNPLYIIGAIICVYLGSLYHTGVIAVICPYLYCFIFLNRKTKKISFNVINIVTLIIVVILAFIILDKNGEEIYGKVTADTGGGSAYLTNIEMNNPIDLMIWGPVKQIFLLFSPMPWLIRGGMDIATFLFDSSVYIFIAYMVFRNFKIIPTNIKMLLLVFILATFIFGLGSLNTGTAIRHKSKFLSLMIISYIYIKDRKEDLK